LFLEAGQAIPQSPVPKGSFQDGTDLRRRKRLRQVIERAAAHGIDRIVDACIRRDDHDLRARRESRVGVQ
jgi:hypothetical protein